ncbi:MAG TPA: hypothetical protein VGN57_03405 [Pirellulaceae bacterium]|jgi:hypothetical protein|nr:hypothetical protein [Pirellulaceae bacterium]
MHVARFAFALAVATTLAPFFSTPVRAQTQISVDRRGEFQGTVRSVGPGRLVVMTEKEGEIVFRIQGKADRGIALAGGAGIVNEPAVVSVQGEIPEADVPVGAVIRFDGAMNRAGAFEQELESFDLLDDQGTQAAVEILAPAAESTGHAEVRITAPIVRRRSGRLYFQLPQNEATRKSLVFVTPAANARGSLSSDDYQRATPGSKAKIRAVHLNTGDWIAIEANVELAAETAGSTIGADVDEQLVAKFRNLSDEPSPPRDVRSQFFLLHTDLSDRESQILLAKLERMVRLVSGYFGKPPAQPIECYVVRDLSQWPVEEMDPFGVQQIADGAGVTRSARLGQQRMAIVYSCDDHGTVQHEAMHAYCSLTYGSTGPTWLSEGVAELGNYWKEGRLDVQVDPVVIAYLQGVQPKKKLLEIVAPGQATGDSWQNYSWRWALCHLLANNPNYGDRFRALALGLMEQREGVSFEAVYGPVAPQISFEYELFLQQLDNGYRADLCAWEWNERFKELALDRRMSAKIEAKRGWQASGLRVEKGVSYDVAAVGEWVAGTNAEPVSAGGDQQGAGRLVGVLYDQFALSQEIDLGAKTTFVAPADGDLFLRSKNAWNRIAEHEGQIEVHLRRTPAPAPAPEKSPFELE